jgi:hypothetical protein
MGNYTPDEIIFIVEESPEGGYEARSLNYSIFTEADTFDELKCFRQLKNDPERQLLFDPPKDESLQYKIM